MPSVLPLSITHQPIRSRPVLLMIRLHLKGAIAPGYRRMVPFSVTVANGRTGGRERGRRSTTVVAGEATGLPGGVASVRP